MSKLFDYPLSFGRCFREHEEDMKIFALFAVALMVILGTYALIQGVYEADAKAQFDTSDLKEALGGAALDVKSQIDERDSKAALWAKSTGADALRATADADLFHKQLDSSAK